MTYKLLPEICLAFLAVMILLCWIADVDNDKED